MSKLLFTINVVPVADLVLQGLQTPVYTLELIQHLFALLCNSGSLVCGTEYPMCYITNALCFVHV